MVTGSSTIPSASQPMLVSSSDEDDVFISQLRRHPVSSFAAENMGGGSTSGAPGDHRKDDGNDERDGENFVQELADITHLLLVNFSPLRTVLPETTAVASSSAPIRDDGAYEQVFDYEAYRSRAPYHDLSANIGCR